MDIVHVRPVQLHACIYVLDGFVSQFLTASDALQMSAVAAPDRNRRAPVSRSGNSPVLNICDPVAEALLAYEWREPVDAVVVGNQVILQLAHFDVPAWLSIVDQRRAAAPAVWIVMLQLCLGVDFVLIGQPFDDFYVQAFLHNKMTFPRCRRVASSLVYRLQHRQFVFAAALVVVFAEGRG